jgi:hypothetical protein
MSEEQRALLQALDLQRYQVSSMAFTREKTAVPDPIPSPSDTTATAVKPGFFSNWRKAKVRSLMMVERD